MRYRIEHITQYKYGSEVDLCHNQVRLLPRNTDQQQVISHQFIIDPKPENITQRVDFFGNPVTYFSIEHPHDKLTVTSLSEVEIYLQPKSSIPFHQVVSWEYVRDILAAGNYSNFEASIFVFGSSMASISYQALEYVKPIFQKGRPLLEAVSHLMYQIYNDFSYVPGYTNISTPLSQVFMERKGVCQDFAHVAISCLRSIGLAARYVSGYIETLPPEGNEKLRGADASHAWISVYVPESGWYDFDPTNNMVPSGRHITIAFGRDFSDITPLKGVVRNSSWQSMKVLVDVEKI